MFYRTKNYRSIVKVGANLVIKDSRRFLAPNLVHTSLNNFQIKISLRCHKIVQ